jgi:galactokinase
LVGSKYNERFAECGAALKLLKKKFEVGNLCDLSMAEFELNKNLIDDPVLQNRALHVISENARVKDAVIALQTEDMEVFGKLMYASHQSLRDFYEVTGKELDTIVEFCKTFDGCIGSRMTGAGFGGCAIALIKKNRIDDFASKLKEHYKNEIGYGPDIFVSGAEDGVREVKL